MNLEIKECPHGMGVFALSKYEPEQEITKIIGGKIIERKFTKYDILLDIGKWWNFISFPDSYFGLILEHNEHDVEPNSIIRDFRSEPKPNASLISLGSIEPEEEIIIDYGVVLNTKDIHH